MYKEKNKINLKNGRKYRVHWHRGKSLLLIDTECYGYHEIEFMHVYMYRYLYLFMYYMKV